MSTFHFDLFASVHSFICSDLVKMADLIKSVPLILFGFFLLFTIKDLFVSHWNAEASNKDIPVTNLGSSKFMGPTLKILYW